VRCAVQFQLSKSGLEARGFRQVTKEDDMNEEIKNGVTGLGVMAIVFITAKLIGLLDWSWWAVLIPVYIVPLAMTVASAAVFVILVAYLVCVAWDQVLKAIKELSK
jgi:hypothetical protein